MLSSLIFLRTEGVSLDSLQNVKAEPVNTSVSILGLSDVAEGARYSCIKIMLNNAVP